MLRKKQKRSGVERPQYTSPQELESRLQSISIEWTETQEKFEKLISDFKAELVTGMEYAVSSNIFGNRMTTLKDEERRLLHIRDEISRKLGQTAFAQTDTSL